MTFDQHPIWIGMVAALRESFQQVPKETWINWAHVGTTSAILIFLWTQYQGSVDEKQEIASQVKVLASELRSARDLEDHRHATEAQRDVEIEHRIDVQREDIRDLQKEMAAHFDKGR